MQLFYQPELPKGVYFLSREESLHCVKVLRKKVDDLIHITDGKGSLYFCKILVASAKECEFEVISIKKEKGKNYSVHIGIAPTKNIDRLEWFVEKATEIGIDEISLIKTINSERTVVKTERLKKKAISAMKQSLKFSLPLINEIVDFRHILNTEAENRCIAYVDNASATNLSEHISSSTNMVLIGPEGDFDDEEIKLAKSKGWSPVNLGPSRLRTETAGLVACHLIHIFNQN
ncbi:MAG: 16S rRNA (uracil(1498)-N(3))-methyltransferase [Bacteroidota bacterium]